MGGALENPLQNHGSLQELLLTFLEGVVMLGAIALLLALVYVGFLFVKARGNEQELKDARRALVWTVIGGLILLGAEGIALILEATALSL
ncbi:hypothetical protein L0Y34_02130 [Candidatus Parcubacteria bacterium]|nr:hypothetical protein [Candidatus Parcubacteria bacterium]